jgi:3-oxoacyl-[acyl-carrier protein] reductase/meso-butanediol dehydrogenase/(S,S)-butanediol dehydrogenase/diacetyl reductase
MSKATQRTIVITGGGKGIGASIARTFTQAGDRILIGSRTDSGLARELGAEARYQKCDVVRQQELRDLMREAVDWTGRLDVLINNAGVSEWKPLEEVDENFWQRMIDINLKGAFFACQAASSHMKEAASIINISSLAGKRGSANNAVYCAAKFGVNGITQALAKELGPKGIRVNAVCPVYVETEGLTEALSSDDAPPGGKDIKSYLAEFAKTQAALGRLPSGDEVAQTCFFLASPAASAITGQCINVDCGVLPQ